MTLRKKIGIVFLATVFIVAVFSLWFVSRTHFFDHFTVTYFPKSENVSAYVNAYTPTGRKVRIPFNGNHAAVRGFYNRIFIELPCELKTNEVQFIHAGSPFILKINNHCTSDRILMMIPAKIINDDRFFIKIPVIIKSLFVFSKQDHKILKEHYSSSDSLRIVKKQVNAVRDKTKASDKHLSAFFHKLILKGKSFFSIDMVQEVSIAMAALILFSFSMIIYFKFRRRIKRKQDNEKNKISKSIASFFAGLFFWTFISILLLEIVLRLFGVYFSQKNAASDAKHKKGIYTVLCLGDSFTYGIGATPEKSYPEQLKALITAGYGKKINVINAGVCAGNTTQMLESVQKLLDKHHPDVIVMLFGMANSWNYYGYTLNDNILYRIRTYKLFKRLKQNLDYRKNGFEMFKKVDDFSKALMIKSLTSFVQRRPVFDISYYSGRYFLSKRNWCKALKLFSYAASKNSMNDSTLSALCLCINKIDENIFYSEYSGGLINKTIVLKTIMSIDTLIRQYPKTQDFLMLKFRYYLDKGDPGSALSVVKEYSSKFKVPEKIYFYFNRSKNDSLAAFYRKNAMESASFVNGKAYFLLGRNMLTEAASLFKKSLSMEPGNYYAVLGAAICEAAGSHDVKYLFRLKTDFYKVNAISAFLLTYYHGPLNNSCDVYSYFIDPWETIFKKQKNLLCGNDRKLKSMDSLFLLSCSSNIENLNIRIEEHHESFFLNLKYRRSMKITDKNIFSWIESDINAVVDICTKQGYPVICMNYPLIPPPNSEEISFWAAHVGQIWMKIALRKDLPFINNDSIFSRYGDKKSDLFEPKKTGSEHCNEIGYQLMARNIYQCMLKNKLFKLSK